MDFSIHPVSKRLKTELQAKIDHKTKPPGSLGLLEPLALRIGLIQNTLTPGLEKPTIVVCAGDHGATAEGISAYPSAVTAQMVLNFLQGGAAINALARANGLDLRVVDAGVDYDFPDDGQLIQAKVAHGTRNYVSEPAMTRDECEQALGNGAELVDRLHEDGCNVVGFGEMGIGNSAAAALLMSVFCHLPLERCVGAGAGLDEAGVYHKIKVLTRARERISSARALRDPITALSEFGGFEIVTICGGMLRAAEHGMIVLVDGFIASSALLAAQVIDRRVIDYCIASHRSDEAGHTLMLQQLRARPLLDLRMRLGEGTGAALAYPLVRSAVAFLNDMASFESASVSGKIEQP